MTDDHQRARELLAMCLDDWGCPTEASNVRASEDLESYECEFRLLQQLRVWGLLQYPQEGAALRAAPEWQPIETAPEGRLVVVGWLDAEDSHYPENYEFDYLEDGLWAKHEDCVEHAFAVAPPGSQMPKEHPPYQWWMDLPAFPAARPQGVR